MLIVHTVTLFVLVIFLITLGIALTSRYREPYYLTRRVTTALVRVGVILLFLLSVEFVVWFMT